MQVLFADGIGEITVIAGVVRMEYFVQLKKGKDNSTTELRPAFSVNIPIDGFANSMAGLQNLMEKMLKDGVVKQRPGGPWVAGALTKPSSPNFS